MKFTFQKASKQQMKARVAITGPAGSGKTTNALLFAQRLAGDRGSIAVIDTERGSASLYSDRFNFDTVDFVPPYDPRVLCEAIDAAAAAGYEVLVIDSLSHFWAGEGGLLEQVDAASGNKFANGWKTATPIQNKMVEKILGYPGHVITTMRSKTAYVVENTSGKSVPRKVGQAPIQREGLEFEFTLVLDIDRDHSIGISKTRCAELETTTFLPGSEIHNLIETFTNWLSEGDAATLPAKAAKLRLFQAVQDRGWSGDDAKNIAKELWDAKGVTDERIEQAVLDEMLRSVPRAEVEVDPFLVEEEVA
jgi:energy-coupling factor transporter ATP-binding protein EcfA2